MRVLAACAFLAAALAYSGHAGGAGGVPVQLSFESCADSLAPEVDRIARIELHAAHVGEGSATQIGVECAGDDVKLTVDDPLTGKRVERSVSLASVAQESRARLLALAIAELVRSSWIELQFRRRPVLPIPARAPVSVEQQDLARAIAAAPPTAVWGGYAAVEALFVPSVGSPIFGLTLGVQRSIAPWGFVEGGVSGWDGTAERSSGTVAIREIAVDPAIGVHADFVDLALGVRVCWTSLAGTPIGGAFRGESISGLSAGPMVAASVGIIGPLRLWVRGGWIVQGERGIVAGDSDVNLGGAFGSIGLGLRIRAVGSNDPR